MLRDQLVDRLVASGTLRDPAIEAAFRRVPREAFLPGVELERIYRDDAIVTKTEDGVGVSSSSQPAIMAIMLQQLELAPGMRVLEIGAGTGYNAALLRELVGPDGQVTTVDIDEEVAGWARERLDHAGYRDVAVHAADGADGWPPRAPYDRIILTVGAADIAPAWVEQLRPDGVLVIPLWINTAQLSVAFERLAGDSPVLRSRSVTPCGFMRIRGKLAGTERYIPLGPEVTIGIGGDDVPVETLTTLLAGEPRREPWDGALWDGFFVHTALRDAGVLMLHCTPLPGRDQPGGGFGLFAGEPDPALAAVIGPFDDSQPELCCWGGESARTRMLAAREEWVAAGAPDVRALGLSVYPLGHAPTGTGVDTRWWRITVTTTR
jgi:protein-L-isoaspartate(D-aspartate) O-methyltransferase